jgi:hypothetical protein
MSTSLIMMPFAISMVITSGSRSHAVTGESVSWNGSLTRGEKSDRLNFFLADLQNHRRQCHQGFSDQERMSEGDTFTQEIEWFEWEIIDVLERWNPR